MLEKVDKSGNEYINDYGQRVIEHIVKIRENTKKRKEINLDDALEDCDEIYDAYHSNDWKEVFSTEKELTELDKNDFFIMDYRTSQYYIYKLLVSINSSLLDIKEVLKDEKLSR